MCYGDLLLYVKYRLENSPRDFVQALELPLDEWVYTREFCEIFKIDVNEARRVLANYGGYNDMELMLNVVYNDNFNFERELTRIE